MGEGFQAVDYIANHQTSVVFGLKDGHLFIAHLGDSLGESLRTTDIPAAVLSRGVMGGSLDHQVIPEVFPSSHHGWLGTPGCEMSQHGQRIAVSLTYQSHEHSTSTNSTVFHLLDNSNNISIALTVTLHESNVVTFSTQLKNFGNDSVSLQALNLCLPIDARAEELLTLGGRHAMEAVQHRVPWKRTQHLMENRSGRTSHEQLGVVFAGTAGFSEQQGHVWGVHLAWSGNFRIVCDGVTETLKTIHICCNTTK